MKNFDKERELAIKLVNIYKELEKFSAGLSDLGLDTDRSYLSQGMGDLEESILDLLEVPEETWNEETQTGNCRDYWYDGFFGFIDNNESAEFLVDWVLAELEASNGEQENSRESRQ